MADDPSLRWTTHIEWTDGAIEEVIGQSPTVRDGVLRVAVEDEEGADFEAQYPLRFVRVWWCNYTGGDHARKNSKGSRRRVRERRGPGSTS